MFLTFPKGCGVHHHLMFAVGQGDSVVALDHAFTGRHLGTVVISDVALLRLAGLANLVFMGGQKLVDLVDLVDRGIERLDLSLGRCLHRLVNSGHIVRLMLREQMLSHALHLLRLFLQVRLGAAPFLRGIARQPHSIDSEHLLADQPCLIAHQLHVAKDRRDLGRQ